MSTRYHSRVPICTLITDFGTKDGYVGAMKGVMLGIAPGLEIVDVTHDIPPQDIAGAAFALGQAAPFFPPDTVHVVVVDPGVGGRRRCVVVDDGRQRYVGPDNGLFALAVPAPVKAWEITAPAFRRAEVAPTFHGRDVFAPAAALVASGAKPEDAGPVVRLEGRLAWPPIEVREAGRVVIGHVVHVDRFGNLISDIAAAMFPKDPAVRIGRRVLPLLRTFEDVPAGHPLAYVGAAGTLEIAVRDGSASGRLRLGRGAMVRLETR